MTAVLVHWWQQLQQVQLYDCKPSQVQTTVCSIRSYRPPQAVFTFFFTSVNSELNFKCATTNAILWPLFIQTSHAFLVLDPYFSNSLSRLQYTNASIQPTLLFSKLYFFKLSPKFPFLPLSHWISQEPTTVGLSYSCLCCHLLIPLPSLLQVQHSLKIFFLLSEILYKSCFHAVTYPISFRICDSNFSWPDLNKMKAIEWALIHFFFLNHFLILLFFRQLFLHLIFFWYPAAQCSWVHQDMSHI